MSDIAKISGIAIASLAGVMGIAGAKVAGLTWPSGGGGFVPSDIAGMLAWHSASDITGLSDGSQVQTWPDISGNSKDFSYTVHKPIYHTNEVNGQAAIYWNGSDDQKMDTPTISGAKTIVVVAKYDKSLFKDPADNGVYAGLISEVAGEDGFWFMGQYNQDHWYTSGAIPEHFYKDGVETTDAVTAAWHVFTATVSTGRSKPLRIGQDRGNMARYWLGYMAEILVYDSVISGDNFTNLTSYLKSKYGIA